MNQILMTIKRTDTVEDGVLTKRVYLVSDLPGLWDGSNGSRQFEITVWFSGRSPAIKPELGERQSFTLEGLHEYEALLLKIHDEVEALWAERMDAEAEANAQEN